MGGPLVLQINLWPLMRGIGLRALDFEARAQGFLVSFNVGRVVLKMLGGPPTF